MKERYLKMAAIILAALIAVGIILIIVGAIAGRTGSLHPAKNDASSKWEEYMSADYESEDVTSMPEGFYVHTE